MKRIINPSYSITTELWDDATRAVAIELRDENGEGSVELVFTDLFCMHLANEMTDTAKQVLDVLESAVEYDEAVLSIGLMDQDDEETLTTEALDE